MTSPPCTPQQAAKLAEFHEIPPAYLAKHLQALARVGIIEPAYGKNGGYRLGKPADSISLLAIVTAVEGEEYAFRCTEIRRNGPCGGLPDECYPRTVHLRRRHVGGRAGLARSTGEHLARRRHQGDAAPNRP